MIQDLINLRRKLASLSDPELVRIYKTVFTSPEGQLVLEDLRMRGFYYAPTYDPIAHGMGVNEGMRTLILHIENQVHRDLETEEPKESTQYED